MGFTKTVKTIQFSHFCEKMRIVINLQNRLESIWCSQINPPLMIVYNVYPKSKPVSTVNQLKCVIIWFTKTRRNCKLRKNLFYSRNMLKTCSLIRPYVNESSYISKYFYHSCLLNCGTRKSNGCWEWQDCVKRVVKISETLNNPPPSTLQESQDRNLDLTEATKT